MLINEHGENMIPVSTGETPLINTSQQSVKINSEGDRLIIRVANQKVLF